MKHRKTGEMKTKTIQQEKKKNRKGQIKFHNKQEKKLFYSIKHQNQVNKMKKKERRRKKSCKRKTLNL